MAESALVKAEDHGFYFLASEEGSWKAAASAGEVMPLYLDPDDGIESRLVRFTAKDSTGGAPELLGREVIVVSGAFVADGERLEAGDFHRAVGASVSGRSETGCVLFTLIEAGASAGTGDAPDVGTRADARTVRSTHGSWKDAGDGTRLKLLTADLAHRLQIKLVRMEAGASYPPHRHAGAEELFLLRGDCTCQGRRLGPGDYHRSDPGTRHDATTSEAGCELIVVKHGIG